MPSSRRRSTPTSSEVALRAGVSRTTVTAAYAQLIAEGYLLNRPGARAIVARGSTGGRALEGGCGRVPGAAPTSGAWRAAQVGTGRLARDGAAARYRSLSDPDP